MKLQRTIFRTLVLSTILFSTGCVAFLLGGAAGGSAYAYISGELQATESVPLDRAWLASQQALRELDLKIIGQDKDSLTGRLDARGAEDKTVTVHLERVSDNSTKVGIRVGTFGDRRLAEQILGKIERAL